MLININILSGNAEKLAYQITLWIRGLVSKETGAASLGSRNECLVYQRS